MQSLTHTYTHTHTHKHSGDSLTPTTALNTRTAVNQVFERLREDEEGEGNGGEHFSYTFMRRGKCSADDKLVLLFCSMEYALCQAEK